MRREPFHSATESATVNTVFTPPNPHLWKLQAQARKAVRLAEVLSTYRATADEVAGLSAQGRRTVEALADVPESSDETWAMVLGYLVGRAVA